MIFTVAKLDIGQLLYLRKSNHHLLKSNKKSCQIPARLEICIDISKASLYSHSSQFCRRDASAFLHEIAERRKFLKTETVGDFADAEFAVPQ